LCGGLPASDKQVGIFFAPQIQQALTLGMRHLLADPLTLSQEIPKILNPVFGKCLTLTRLPKRLFSAIFEHSSEVRMVANSKLSVGRFFALRQIGAALNVTSSQMSCQSGIRFRQAESAKVDADQGAGVNECDYDFSPTIDQN
jgi:hypothetical protein